jgi:uncharacterized damage-inducible protein DinB
MRSQDATATTYSSDLAIVAAPLVRLLDEMCHVVGGLSDAQYVQKPVGVMSSSIGGHVRHWLDHVSALLASVETGRLSYDHRERGTSIETDRWAALAAITQLAVRLRDLRASDLDRPLDVESLLAADDEPQTFGSTVGRELAYVVSHSVHHNAIIGAMVQTLGGRVPPRFGYAPSTIAHAARNPPRIGSMACAR